MTAEAQALRYAEELSTLVSRERHARQQAEQTALELRRSYATTVRALAAALDLRDDATGAHAARVTVLGMRLARTVAPLLARDEQLEFAFLLHDIGKIGVSDAVLLKAGPLTANERSLIERHSELGEQIILGIPHLGSVVREVVRSHHERWDGRGYPDGLRETEIPLAARIFAIADTYDAITSDRSYRPAAPTSVALREIRNGAGRQFDPALVSAFLEIASDS